MNNQRGSLASSSGRFSCHVGWEGRVHKGTTLALRRPRSRHESQGSMYGEVEAQFKGLMPAACCWWWRMVADALTK